MRSASFFPLLLVGGALFPAPVGGARTAPADPLPSWNDTAPKKALTAFVAKVTKDGSPDFVPPAERVAVFDNDGTLWCEQPIYVQFAFAIDRVKALADKHPEWKDQQPFKAVLEGDHKALAASGEKGLAAILIATHTGMSIEEFEATVTDWLATARHPKYERPYTECVYQPMLEVLAYLRANGFKTFIVSGGTADFMRPWAEKVYGVPPEQVVGTTFKTKYAAKDGKSTVVIEPHIDLIDDHAGKPVGIARAIGRRPLMAFGNSDGDFEMLEYTTTAKGPRFGLLVHHTDTEREFAYDRKSPIGKLDRGLDEASNRGWVVASIKDDWKTVFSTKK
ncbi:haloacid dehalogenase : NapD-like protein OS=Pirellula staleyi (strain ATCC 27377 / DSM 6068 / ICPB 4128) GN=Psta_1819 PE=4 SV=1: HAD [Gemmata massiliana]|uniref:Haloacid dehalogenase-like hydrolase n=1 Tax=Gemmata massiliana TaxID=1210884 RepID=A0A6P2CQM1_9BACT|nr:HAD family hydrolase [Gemmata massiliana]VTR91251.1 haloacid dehalogenase : NapD-like protein OS=Pirellula staleyi (strain ATCC 27377 / DSM 6068 / ICPB 4128) GN=Psta_1819 PE=4 SV=1: HAD [Gemmata massiliana]